MPTYEVKAPEGTTYRVNAPDGATEADAIAYVQKNFASKPSAPVKIGRDAFPDTLAQVVSEQNPITAAIAQGGNTAMQYVRGLRQMIGGGDTPEGKNQDLLRSEINKQFPVAGPVGDIGAQIGLTYLGAKALPLGAITSKAPALANPYVANMATGAALGGLKYGDLGERAKDAGLGAAGGVGGTLAGRIIPAAYQGLKGIVEPFTKGGQENIVGRTLNQFAVDPSRVASAGTYASKVPGVVPTTAEAALDPGISNLQRQFAVGLTDRQLGNNAARVQALRTVGGSDAAIAAAKDTRESAANALYGQAFKSDAMRLDLAKQAEQAASSTMAGGLHQAIPTTAGQIADDLATPGLRELATRPAFASAVKEAKTLAANLGDPIGDPLSSVKGLHYIKLALDQALNGKLPNSALAGYGDKALQGIKGTFLSELESDAISPLYGNARKTFADLSKPINSMEVGNEILKKSSTAAEDALGNPTLHNEALSRAVRDGNALAQRVTGFNKATLADTLDPAAMDTLSAVRRDLARKVAADNLGKANGSPTAQNLASMNLMRQIAGPLGMPSGFAEARGWPTFLRGMNWVMKAQDPKIEGLLIDALKDPKLAAALAARKATQPNVSGLLGPVENYAIPGISLGLLDARQ